MKFIIIIIIISSSSSSSSGSTWFVVLYPNFSKIFSTHKKERKREGGYERSLSLLEPLYVDYNLGRMVVVRL